MDHETRPSDRQNKPPPSQHAPNEQGPQIPENPPFGVIDREHPIGGQMSDILLGLFTRARLPWLLSHRSQLIVLAAFSFINGCISIGLMSILALLTGSPFIFPSLGPTAFLFFYTPTAPSASPRNTLIGHAVGVLAGYFSLVVTGLTTAGPALSIGVTGPRVIAAALSLGLTAGVMVLLKSPHPPAGATTLIVSLGILTQPWKLVLLMVAVVVLTLQAIVINRLAGIPYPLWNPLQPPGADVQSVAKAVESAHPNER
jgi:CBS domain-containing membrane protein